MDALAPLAPELLVATFAPDGKAIFVNESWQLTLGTAEHPWQRLTPADRELAALYLNEAAGGALITNTIFNAHAEDRDEPLPLLLNFIPVHQPRQTHPAIEAITITGEALVEPSTWTLSQTQQHRFETLGRMTMGIVHNFNNLLSAIMGHTEVMRALSKHEPFPPDFTDYLRTIEQAAEDGAEMFKKIQRYIRQGKQKRFEPLWLPALMEDCIMLTRPYWYNEPRRRGIRIETVLEMEEVPPVMGSATELREVFVNLLLNAVQAMPKGGTITVRTTFLPQRGVLVSVSDTGTGMSEQIRRRIFEPLFTTKGAQGTGMGLAVTYGIIREHEASIEVRSQPGEGTCFDIVLPPANGVAQQPEAEEEEAPTQSARVLVVDDEPMVRTVIAKLLALKGHAVVQAASGPEALELAEQHELDIVFTDLGMPEMSGRQLAYALRKQFPLLPIVLLTGDTDFDEPDDNIQMVLGKPFKIEQLEAAIRRLV